MKKINKSLIIGFVIGGIVFSFITVFAYSFVASDVSYTPENENFNANNVNSALNTLYDRSGNLSERIDGSHQRATFGGDQFKDNSSVSMNFTKGNYYVAVGWHNVHGLDYNPNKSNEKTTYTLEDWVNESNFNGITCTEIVDETISDSSDQSIGNKNSNWVHIDSSTLLMKCNVPSSGSIDIFASETIQHANSLVITLDSIKID